MRSETESILDDWLSRWHHFSKGFRVVGASSANAMFRNANTSRQWDAIEDVVDAELMGDTLERMDFEIMGDKRGMGGMEEPYRTAICVNARNCYTGRQVWMSPRLPEDAEARALIVSTARIMLIDKLMRAGIM